MRTPALIVLATTLVFAGCGGGGGSNSSVTPPLGGGGTQQSSQTNAENSINTANSLGTPMKTITNFNNSVQAESVARSNGAFVAYASGTCNSGVEYFAPDKNGDANSTETQMFYDSGCTQLARDVVRIYTISGSSESVNRSEKIYAINNSTPSATHTSSVNFINGSYGPNGYPVVANGFDRSSAGELDLAGAKTLVSDDELVMLPASGSTNNFCSDAAGYNATGIASLNETFGWQGGVTSGTRTVNTDGSVTWSATHTGFTAKGAIGSLSIGIAAANTTCPIATPEYSLTGGTQAGQYSLPITATYLHGELTNLTVTNATLANGNTLNVTTNTSVSPTSSTFITGIVSNGGTQIATFAVNTFGDGTLTVTSSGAQYVMNDWHVVK